MVQFYGADFEYYAVGNLEKIIKLLEKEWQNIKEEDNLEEDI